MLPLGTRLHHKRHHRHNCTHQHSVTNRYLQDCPLANGSTHIFWIGDTAKGAINDTTVDILDTTVPGGSFWACHVTAYDPAQFDELLRLANNDGLGKVSARLIIPRLTSGQAWCTSPLT